MNKHSVDYIGLEKSLTAPKSFRLKDVEHRLEKVAFGTVRFMNPSEDIDGLWEIQNTDDGEVIIAKYDYDNPEMTSKSSWDVIPDARGKTMNVFYKGEPVVRLAAPEGEVAAICKNASVRLEKDAQFRTLLLEEVGAAEKAELLNKFPELVEANI
jgi:hypothetical protein